MVPSGDATEATIAALADELEPGDTIIDGGNANYKDSFRRAGTLGEKGASASSTAARAAASEASPRGTA